MLIAIVGRKGHGKTLLMTIINDALSKSGIKTYATYHLENAEFISSREKLIQIENAGEFLDEFWLNVDSRLWKDNVFLTRWINQTRKRNLLVFYTTQHMKQIDVRVRRGTDLAIFCEKLKSQDELYFRYSFIDPNTGRIMRSIKLSEGHAKLFYSKYDTAEVVLQLKHAKTNHIAGKSYSFARTEPA